MGIKTRNEMAAVDLANAGNGRRLILRGGLAMDLIFGNGLEHIQKVMHGSLAF